MGGGLGQLRIESAYWRDTTIFGMSLLSFGYKPADLSSTSEWAFDVFKLDCGTRKLTINPPPGHDPLFFTLADKMVS